VEPASIEVFASFRPGSVLKVRGRPVAGFLLSTTTSLGFDCDADRTQYVYVVSGKRPVSVTEWDIPYPETVARTLQYENP